MRLSRSGLRLLVIFGISFLGACGAQSSTTTIETVSTETETLPLDGEQVAVSTIGTPTPNQTPAPLARLAIVRSDFAGGINGATDTADTQERQNGEVEEQDDDKTDTKEPPVEAAMRSALEPFAESAGTSPSGDRAPVGDATAPDSSMSNPSGSDDDTVSVSRGDADGPSATPGPPDAETTSGSTEASGGGAVSSAAPIASAADDATTVADSPSPTPTESAPPAPPPSATDTDSAIDTDSSGPDTKTNTVESGPAAADPDSGEATAGAKTTPTPVAVAMPTAEPTPTTQPTAPPTPPPTVAPAPPPAAPGGTVLVAKAKSTTGVVETFDASGNPAPVRYRYLDGAEINYGIRNPTFFGGTLHLQVVNGAPTDEFVEVAMPVRPAGTTGWVRSDAFEFYWTQYSIEVNITTNTVRVWNGSDLVVETRAVTGRSDRPTPVARTYVDEILPGPNAAYGPNMLTLALFSESLNTFSNALPKIAIHGTNQPELMGSYASSGCIRIPNDVIKHLAAVVPPGTPVSIVR